MPTGYRLLPGNDLEGVHPTRLGRELELADFILTEATKPPGSILIGGEFTPRPEEHSRAQFLGGAYLPAQLELAWLDGDDDTARHIIRFM